MAKVYNFRTKSQKLNDWLTAVFSDDNLDEDCHIVVLMDNDTSHKFCYYNCEPDELRRLKDLVNEGYLDVWLKHHINDYICYVNE